MHAHRRYLPNKVIAYRDPATPPDGAVLAALLEGKQPLPPGPTLFVCQDSVCQAPVSGTPAVLAVLESLA